MKYYYITSESTFSLRKELKKSLKLSITSIYIVGHHQSLEQMHCDKKYINYLHELKSLITMC